jgi:hypothetical protein
MTPNSVRIKNALTVSNGASISGNVVISNGQLVVGGTAINSTSVSEAANNAYTNAIAIAANATNLTSGTVNIARIPVLDVVNNTSISFVATANSVKTSYDAAIAANTLANTAATAAASAYTNAVSYTDTKIGTANTAMAANADAAYTNSIIFSANASNANNGTLAEARLPFRMDQAVRTTDSPTFANGSFTGSVAIGGTLTITGNLISQNVQSLAVADPLIKLGVNNASDVLWGGFTFHYNGSGNTTNHAGLVRSPTSKEFILMSTLGDESGVFNNNDINIADPTFSFANLQVNIIKAGNSTVFSTINTTSFSGTANNATNFDGSSLATVQGQITGNAATAYTNATIFAANASNANNGTLAFARLPTLYLGTSTIQSTSAAQAVSGVTTLEAGNTTITGFANVSVSVNSALFTVGTSVVINATSMTTSGGQFVANSTGISVSGSITSACSSFIVSSTGVLTSPDLVDAVGYKGLPQNSQAGAYGLVLADMGKMINTTTGGVVIPANANVAFPIGSAISIFNNSGSNQTISITSDTLRQAGTASTGSRTLAQYGLATCVKVAATTWAISGAGVT